MGEVGKSEEQGERLRERKEAKREKEGKEKNTDDKEKRTDSTPIELNSHKGVCGIRERGKSTAS